MKNQEVYIPRPAKAMMAEIESLKAALAVAIAERDAAIAKTSLEGYRELGRQTAEALDQRDEAISRNQSLTTLCAELVEALELAKLALPYVPRECECKICKAITHATELLKKKD